MAFGVSPLINQKYDYSHAVKLGEIITPEFVESLPIRHLKNCKRAEHRGKFVRGIFATFLGLVQEHLIDHNEKFVAPVYPVTAYYIQDKRHIDMQRILKQCEVYRDVDLLATRGRMYEMVVYSRAFRGRRTKLPIRMDYKRY